MRILSRSHLLFLASAVSLFLALGAAWPGQEMGALIWWCPEIPGAFPWEFHLEVVYRGTVSIRDSTSETFYFGDGASAPVVLTATEVHPGSPEG